MEHPDDFELLGEISDIEIIAVGRRIRELAELVEAHGIGKRRMRVKETLERR